MCQSTMANLERRWSLRDGSDSNPKPRSAVSPPTQSLPATRGKKTRHVRSRSDQVGQVQCGPPPSTEEAIRTSTSFPAQLTTGSVGRRSILDEGGRVAPPTECFFPRPHRGQSLTSFLSSADFGTCAQLDRENAHIYVSEALIAAMEHLRCSRVVERPEEQADSDEDIRQLQHWIHVRRRERLREKALKRAFEPQLSDGRTDATSSTSPPSSENSSPSCRVDVSDDEEDDAEDFELSDATGARLASPLASPCSGESPSHWRLSSGERLLEVSTDTEVPEASLDLSLEEPSKLCSSAEAVALSLLKRFSGKRLPKASDLQWLVSEHETDQSLLPLPDAWPVSPDQQEEEYTAHKLRLRGNSEWAPPREQIIFSVQPELKRKLQLAKQNYRCAGCGMRVSTGQLGRLRYCSYLGKLFCRCCHSDARAIIPGRVLERWDFGLCPVSNFARDLLERMAPAPLFNIRDVNPALYSRVRSLEKVRQCRLALGALEQYIRCCRQADSLQQQLQQLPPHLLSEPHVYSLEELWQVRMGGPLVGRLRSLRQDCQEHCLSCPLCTAKAFICERCREPKDLLFPFQLATTTQCQGCKACFHRACFVPGACDKCRRLEDRRKSLLQSYEPAT